MFSEKVKPDVALADITRLLDSRNLLPSMRKSKESVIPIVQEAIQYGLVTIDDNCQVAQSLIEPVKDDKGNVVLDTLVYVSRIDPAKVNKRINELKVRNETTRLLCYTIEHTGETEGILNKMESQDRNICDAITIFFS
jgi:hypothetical protein